MAKGCVEFRVDRCKGCGLCISVCPRKILGFDKEQVNIKGYHPATCLDPDSCVGCASCAIMCPDGVITVYREEA